MIVFVCRQPRSILIYLQLDKEAKALYETKLSDTGAVDDAARMWQKLVQADVEKLDEAINSLETTSNSELSAAVRNWQEMAPTTPQERAILLKGLQDQGKMQMLPRVQ